MPEAAASKSPAATELPAVSAPPTTATIEPPAAEMPAATGTSGHCRAAGCVGATGGDHVDGDGGSVRAIGLHVCHRRAHTYVRL